jgi:hypothetical protein
MGLLDGGLAAIFGAAFGGVYLAGTLHRVTLGEDEDGRRTKTKADVPMRYQREALSEQARAAAGIPAKDIKLLILAHELGGKPTAEDEFTTPEGRFRIAACETDPASTHFIVRGSPVA